MRAPPVRFKDQTADRNQPIPKNDTRHDHQKALPSSSISSDRACAVADLADGEAVNHPANLAAVYRGYADFTGEPVERLAARVRRNFTELFGV